MSTGPEQPRGRRQEPWDWLATTALVGVLIATAVTADGAGTRAFVVVLAVFSLGAQVVLHRRGRS